MSTKVMLMRMNKELMMLAQAPPPGVSAWCVDGKVNELEAVIQGPEDTPYEEGYFKLEINIPERYPNDPPKVRFVTPVYHPNIDNGGRICLDTLKMPPKGAWTPSLNIPTLLTTLRLLLSMPNPDDPLMPDITEEFIHNHNLFVNKAKSWTRKHANQLQPPEQSDKDNTVVNAANTTSTTPNAATTTNDTPTRTVTHNNNFNNNNNNNNNNDNNNDNNNNDNKKDVKEAINNTSQDEGMEGDSEEDEEEIQFLMERQAASRIISEVLDDSSSEEEGEGEENTSKMITDSDDDLLALPDTSSKSRPSNNNKTNQQNNNNNNNNNKNNNNIKSQKMILLDSDSEDEQLTTNVKKRKN